MAVAPSGRAFAVLRELNKGLPKGQTIKGAEFDRQTADLKREDLRPVKEVQQEMERRARSRSGEKSRQQARPRRAEPNKEQRQGQAQTPDEGKKWALEMRIREERRALDERQAQARERQQDAANARLEKARAEAMQAQRVRQQQQALREAQERLKKGGLLYRVSGQAKQDRETQAETPERLKQSMDRVNNWVERERGNMAEEFKAQAHRQETERAELEKKIEQAQKIGYLERGRPGAHGAAAGGAGRTAGTRQRRPNPRAVGQVLQARIL
jgi:hypothetical protein